MSEGLTLKEVFHSCLWIRFYGMKMSSVLEDPHAYESQLQSSSTVMLRHCKKPCYDLFHPKARKSKLPDHSEERAIVCNKPQSKIKVLDFVLHFSVLAWIFLKQIVCSRYANSSVILCTLFTLTPQKEKYTMKR